MTGALQGSAIASVVDVFCGAGGLSYGFKSSSFQIAAGIDIDEACRFPYEHNNGAPFLRKDVAKLDPAEIKTLFLPRKPRVLVGCAPCQPFSTYSQKKQNSDWQLLKKFGELASSTGPDIISMENVPRLLTFRKGEVFEEFVKTLRMADYEVTWDVLHGPRFGMAQKRSRLVLLASRLGPIALPEPTHDAEAPRTVHDEIGDLPQISHGEADNADLLHRASKLSEVNARRIKSSKPGGTWRDWQPELVSSCHQAATGRGYASVYGRMSWSQPSPTITTQFFGFGSGRFGHPSQDRALSLREGALLQGFPRHYQFVAPGEPIVFKKVARLIGNAVPVSLARAIAGAVKIHLESFQ